MLLIRYSKSICAPLVAIYPSIDRRQLDGTHKEPDIDSRYVGTLKSPRAELNPQGDVLSRPYLKTSASRHARFRDAPLSLPCTLIIRCGTLELLLGGTFSPH